MEISQFGGFSGMGYPSDQWPFVEMNMEDAVFIDNTHHLYGHSPPVMEFKTSSWNSCITSDQSVNRHYASATNQPTRMNPKANNTPQHEHILAERKRREKLSQRFIALSALVPGLKKMDKASVLGDAIKYLKTLKEKVKTLEEEAKKESNTDQSVVFVKKYHKGGEISVDEQLPEVEARYSGKDILIRLHCEKKPGVVEQTLDQIRKLHLTVINITVMTFASYALDITVVAQMDQEFTMKAKDLVKNLRTSLM